MASCTSVPIEGQESELRVARRNLSLAESLGSPILREAWAAKLELYELDNIGPSSPRHEIVLEDEDGAGREWMAVENSIGGIACLEIDGHRYSVESVAEMHGMLASDLLAMIEEQRFWGEANR